MFSSRRARTANKSCRAVAGGGIDLDVLPLHATFGSSTFTDRRCADGGVFNREGLLTACYNIRLAAVKLAYCQRPLPRDLSR